MPTANYLHSLRHLSTNPDDDKKRSEMPTLPTQLPNMGSKSNLSVASMARSTVNGIKSGVKSVINAITDPAATWKMIKAEAHHYWIGSKLFVAEIRAAADIVGRIRQGHELTRREREHLKRTVADIFRLVPFSVFVIVPFMELLLPFALKLFPNMLPSTFQVTI